MPPGAGVCSVYAPQFRTDTTPGGTMWHRMAWLTGWGDTKRYEVTRGGTKPPDFSSDGSNRVI